MQFDAKSTVDTELELARMEEVDSTLFTADPEAELTTYDFDYWVVRDRPPYCV